MRRLLFAGLLYLTGIAVIILLKPTLMFKENGQWKEFGIGRDPEYFTWMPFWLFSIIWSVISYVLILLLEDSYTPSDTYSYSEERRVPQPMRQNTSANAVRRVEELTPGYYMLDEGKTRRNGVPRYVYLGPESPHDGQMPE
jgi:hypothetical protein